VTAELGFERFSERTSVCENDWNVGL
jgi:hypothetical protein